MPDANHLTISILAAVAEDEARRISERTKAALAARKARGLPLGNGANLKRQEEGRRLGTLVRQQRAQARARELLPVLDALQGGGLSLRKIGRAGPPRHPDCSRWPWTASRVCEVRASHTPSMSRASALR